ncbi:MAG: hypothetical protein U0556_07550 [Dehalococcoidia bacterium]
MRTLAGGGLALALILSGWSPQVILRSATAPPAEVQGQSFSVAPGGPLASLGVGPADILAAGGAPSIPCGSLGLICFDPSNGAADDLAGLSFGWDFIITGLPAIEFVVGPTSRGVIGSAVRAEATCSPAEPGADIFESDARGTNLQDLDGNGTPCGVNTGYSLGLAETGQQIDALDRDPCQYIDPNCDGLPELPVLLTLAPGSPTLILLGMGPADVLMTTRGTVPWRWASAADFGLDVGDAIDALCIREDGDGRFGAGDLVLFSLAPGSPALGRLSAGGADLLAPGPLRIGVSAAALGLLPSDDVVGLKCSAALSSLAGQSIYFAPSTSVNVSGG